MPKEELVLSDYLGVLMRRKWFVMAFTVMVTLGTYWWSRQEVIEYLSKGRIKVQRQLNFAQMMDQFIVGTGDPLKNYIFELTSYVVASNAAAALAFPAKPTFEDIAAVRAAISASRIEGSDIIEITSKGLTPMEAKRRGDAVIAAFIEQHDIAMRKNAQDVLDSINHSHSNLVENLRSRESELLQSMGPELVRAHEDDLLAMRRRLTELDTRLQTLRSTGNYTEDYPPIAQTKAQIAEIEKNLQEKLESDFERRAKLTEYQRYKAIMDDIGTFFARKIEEARIAANRKPEVVIVIEPASMGKEISTGRTRKTIAGGLLGLMLGIVLAFIADNLDTSVRTLAEIEEIFRLPVLAVIPHFSLQDVNVPVGHRMKVRDFIRHSLPMDSVRVLARALAAAFVPMARRRKIEDPTAAELIVPFAPRSPATEAYRTLQTNMLLSSRGKPQVFLLTSSSPAEGKTTTVVNLAISFAQAGKRTLLVGANMRRPQMYRIFGLKRERGLSDIFLGDISWRDAVKDHTDVALGEQTGRDLAAAPGMDNLFFITCGGRTIHPAEWLSQPIFDELLKEWQAAFDVVLVDAPPCLPVPDSLILADKIRQVVMVYQLGVTGRESVRRAIISIQNTGAKILGIVLNDLRSSWVDQPEFYHYRTYYGRPE